MGSQTPSSPLTTHAQPTACVMTVSSAVSDSFRVTTVESTEIGGAIGRIKADDPDVGRNAEMEYSIVGGHDTFNIITDQTTQEGVIIIKKVIYSPFSFWCIRVFQLYCFMLCGLHPTSSAAAVSSHATGI